MTPRTANRTQDSFISRLSPWKDTFPEEFETISDCHKFVTRCLLLGVSQLMKSRGLLPATDFKKRDVSEICRCWVFNNKTFTGNRCLQKIKGAMQAVELCYLKEFIVVVSTNDDNTDDAIEVFTWSFAYADGETVITLSKPDGEALVKLTYGGADAVKMDTIQMLKKIRALCERYLKPLPDNAFATFRTTYNQTKPSGYQAPGFYSSSTIYDLDPSAIRAGICGVATAHHKFFISVQSCFLEDRVLNLSGLPLVSLEDSRVEYAIAEDIGAPIAPSPIRDPHRNISINAKTFSPEDIKKSMGKLAIKKSPGRAGRIDGK